MPPLTCFGQACGRIIFIHYWHEEVHITGLVPSWTGNPGYIQTRTDQIIKSKPISSIPSPISALALPPGSCLSFLGDIVWPEGHSWNNPFLSQIAVSGGLYHGIGSPQRYSPFGFDSILSFVHCSCLLQNNITQPRIKNLHGYIECVHKERCITLVQNLNLRLAFMRGDIST